MGTISLTLYYFSRRVYLHNLRIINSTLKVRTICHIHLFHVVLVIPAGAEDGVFVDVEGGDSFSAAEGRYEAGEGKDPFIVFACLGDFLHQVPLDNCVPKLCLRQQVGAADGARILVGCISFCTGQAECILDGVVVNVLKVFHKLIDAGPIFGQV
ncbi:hypothetical protein V6N13_048725 [Hibiscus sabdariffa]